MNLYTKDGSPLQMHGDKVYGSLGQIIGRIRQGRVFGVDGHYVGTIVKDRLSYLAAHSVSIDAPFLAGQRGGKGSSHGGASAVWGDEPVLPDGELND